MKADIINLLNKEGMNYSYSGRTKTFYLNKELPETLKLKLGDTKYNFEVSILEARVARKKLNRTGLHRNPKTLVIATRGGNVLASNQPKGCTEVTKYDSKRRIAPPSPFKPNRPDRYAKYKSEQLTKKHENKR